MGTRRNGIEAAVVAAESFSARGSDCPICKREFRGCPHSIADAHRRLAANVARAAAKEAAGRVAR